MPFIAFAGCPFQIDAAIMLHPIIKIICEGHIYRLCANAARLIFPQCVLACLQCFPLCRKAALAMLLAFPLDGDRFNPVFPTSSSFSCANDVDSLLLQPTKLFVFDCNLIILIRLKKDNPSEKYVNERVLGSILTEISAFRLYFASSIVKRAKPLGMPHSIIPTTVFGALYSGLFYVRFSGETNIIPSFQTVQHKNASKNIESRCSLTFRSKTMRNIIKLAETVWFYGCLSCFFVFLFETVEYITNLSKSLTFCVGLI